jgi:hypothetical protein
VNRTGGSPTIHHHSHPSLSSDVATKVNNENQKNERQKEAIHLLTDLLFKMRLIFFDRFPINNCFDGKRARESDSLLLGWRERA